MKSSIALMALRLVPKKQQYSMLSRAFNYLIEPSTLDSYIGKVFSVFIRNSKFSWTLLFDGKSFTRSSAEPDVYVELDFDDILEFPSSDLLKAKILDNTIKVVGEPADRKFIIDLAKTVDQVKVTACLRRLRQLLGIKSESIEDIPLSSLSIRDVGSERDVNYLRDQAILHEERDPVLAYSLMCLAHGARPQGPFIKRKLNQYRSLGYDRKLAEKPTALNVIPISKEWGYFPVPKAACSSIKLSLYEQINRISYDSSRYEGKHIHDFWQHLLVAMDNVPNTMIVVRDPIERFLSAYASRVLDHHELNRNNIKRVCPWLENTLPHFKPNLTQFIRGFDQYMLVPSIEHHCKPLSWLVNHSLSRFSHVIPLENMDQVQATLRKVTNSRMTVPRAHVGKHKVGLEKLSEEQLNTLLEFYADDYTLLAPWYSEDLIRKKWLEAKQKANQC